MAEAVRQQSRAESSPFVMLRTHATGRPDSGALASWDGHGVITRTWSDVFADVEALAAAFLRTGLHAGQVAMVSMSPSHESVLVDLALRCAGVLALRIAPDVDPGAGAVALADARIDLLVVDSPERLRSLERLPLDAAKLLDTSDRDTWHRLMELGHGWLRHEPHAVANTDRALDWRADQARWMTLEGLVVGAVAGSGTQATIASDDRVLVSGDFHDAFCGQVVDSAVRAGAGVCWIPGDEDIAGPLQEYRPTALALDGRSGPAVEDRLPAARPMGAPWAKSPTTVLAAVAELRSPGRHSRGLRRRAGEVTGLRPWLGQDLGQVLLAAPGPRVLVAVCEALGVEVHVNDSTLVEPLPLPRAVVQAVAKPTLLPRRAPAQVDEAFTRHRATDAPQPPDDAPDVADTSGTAQPDAGAPAGLLPLMGGDSVLDRVLAEKARHRA